MLTLLYWWVVEPMAVVAVVAVLSRFVSSTQAKTLPWPTSVGLGALIGLPLWYILPAWDTTIGQERFSALCSSDAGLVVHRTIELPKEQFGQSGLPLFFQPIAKTRSPGSTEDLFGEDYRYRTVTEHVWSAGPVSHAWIQRRRQELTSRQGELLAVLTDYYFQRGGPPSFAHRNLEHCRIADTRASEHSASALARAVFRLGSSSEKSRMRGSA